MKVLKSIQLIACGSGGSYAYRTRLGWCIGPIMNHESKDLINCNLVAVSIEDSIKEMQRHLEMLLLNQLLLQAKWPTNQRFCQKVLYVTFQKNLVHSTSRSVTFRRGMLSHAHSPTNTQKHLELLKIAHTNQTFDYVHIPMLLLHRWLSMIIKMKLC